MGVFPKDQRSKYSKTNGSSEDLRRDTYGIIPVRRSAQPLDRIGSNSTSICTSCSHIPLTTMSAYKVYIYMVRYMVYIYMVYIYMVYIYMVYIYMVRWTV